MKVDEVKSQYREVSSEEDAQELVLKSMHELDESSEDEAKRKLAESKVQVMSEAYGKVVEGNRHKHELAKVGLNGAIAIIGGIVVGVAADSRIIPRAVDYFLKGIRRV